MTFQLFGFKIGKDDPGDRKKILNRQSFVVPETDDGSVTVEAGGAYGTYFDLEGTARNDVELISRYREMALQPEVDSAISEIVNEAIVTEEQTAPISVQLDKLNYSEEVKEKIRESFDDVMRLLDFNNEGQDIFKRWYIDGRLYYHMVIDKEKPHEGIQELRYIDPRKIKKIREVKKEIDKNSVEVISDIQEYFVYNELGLESNNAANGVKIAPDSICYCHSGQIDHRSKMVLSYLHKAIKPVNQLRMVEDATVIYRLSRAPERRIFYIDVGALPKLKAEQYIKGIMAQYRNKLVYDACLSMDTHIPLLDGRELTLAEMATEHQAGKQNWVYSADPATGAIAPGLVSWAGVTQQAAEVLRVTFDNSESVICTPDHHFPIIGKGKVRADELIVGESTIALYRRKINSQTKDYEQIYQNDTRKWEFTHRAVAKFCKGTTTVPALVFQEGFETKPKNTLHHVDLDRFNNNPSNLAWVNFQDHLTYHKQFAKVASDAFVAKLRGLPPTEFKQWSQQHGQYFKNFWAGVTPEERAEITQRRVDALRHHLAQDPVLAEKFTKLAHANVAAATEAHGLLMQDPEWKTRKYQRVAEGFERAKQTAEWQQFCDGNSQRLKQRWQSTSFRANIISKRAIKLSFDKWMMDRVVGCAKESTGKLGTWGDSIYQRVVQVPGFVERFQALNVDYAGNNLDLQKGFTPAHLRKLVKQFGYRNVSHVREQYSLYNHRVVSIERLPGQIEVGTLTVDRDERLHSFHNFATSAGVFVCNSTGEIRDDKKFLSMMEDFWLPRREGGKGTEIQTLPGGQNLGEMEDVVYFQQKLYASLNVPISRLKADNPLGGLGRAAEISRDELKFSRFIFRLRSRFTQLFDVLLRTQLLLRGVIALEDWANIKQELFYDFLKDTYFAELKDLEIWKERVNVLRDSEDYVGKYYSKEFVRRKLLRQTDEDIESLNAEMYREEAGIDGGMGGQDGGEGGPGGPGEGEMNQQANDLNSQPMPPGPADNGPGGDEGGPGGPQPLQSEFKGPTAALRKILKEMGDNENRG